MVKSLLQVLAVASGIYTYLGVSSLLDDSGALSFFAAMSYSVAVSVGIFVFCSYLLRLLPAMRTAGGFLGLGLATVVGSLAIVAMSSWLNAAALAGGGGAGPCGRGGRWCAPHCGDALILLGKPRLFGLLLLVGEGVARLHQALVARNVQYRPRLLHGHGRDSRLHGRHGVLVTEPRSRSPIVAHSHGQQRALMLSAEAAA
mgnify:CR=1 FL=1